ncbi:MAG: ribose 5-phosphate isomerase B [Acidimicrobiales bacterium]
MKIAVASDHAGYALKQQVADHLRGLAHEVIDLGTDSEASVDFPPFCAAAARAAVTGDVELAFVFGGSGNGEQMAANKVHGCRAALCHDEFTARMARLHNNANVCSMGSRVTGSGVAVEIAEVFVSTAFEGGRHQARLDLLTEIEEQEAAY